MPGLLLPPESSLGVFMRKRFELKSERPEPIPEPISAIPDPMSTIPDPIPDPISNIPDPMPDPMSTMPEPIPEPISTIPDPIPEPISTIPEPMPAAKFFGELFNLMGAFEKRMRWRKVMGGEGEGSKNHTNQD